VSGAGEPDGRRRRRRAGFRAVGVLAAAAVAGLVVWYGWQAWSRDWRAADSGRATSSADASGAHPFDRGERASYRVTWRVGSEGGTEAGRATFGAQPGTDVRHFTLDVETAGWLSNLYELRGRIESWAGADLLPSRQEQHLSEGRRVTDQTIRFDRSAATFSVGDGRPLPLPQDARDGLSAWFYVRTLPLGAGYAALFPVVEGGRAYAVDVRVDRVERLQLGGRDVEAFRLALCVNSASDRREVARAVAWLSTDARRVPLALDLQTSLGSFRVELDAYQRR